MVSALLQWVSGAALLLPVVVGGYAVSGLDRFRRRAFGLYAKGASWLMAAICTGLLYYVLVLALLWREGAFAAAWADPTGSTALIVLLQSLAATATLAFLVAAARRFLAIVQP